MNLQWIKTDRGEVLRDLDLPENAYLRRDADDPYRPRGVHRSGEHVALTVPPWTPGFRKYVTDPRSCHYGQPIADPARDAANVKAATNGQYDYDRNQERSRSRIADARRKAGIG